MAEEKDQVVQDVEESTAEEVTAETEETGEMPEESTEEAAGKKKKSSRADKEKDALKEQIATLEDKVKRQLAEFENFRNRSDREKNSMYDSGAAMAIKKVLPIVDNFERGLQMVPEENKEDPFVEGMNKIYRQLVTELENMGVTPIEALGQPLNPELHNAVMNQESDEYEPGTICMEMQKGYTYHDILLRPSMVAVVPE